MSERIYPRNLPDRYVADHAREVLRWWSGDFGAIVVGLWPLAFPGVPPEAGMGFASNGHPNEDTGTIPNPPAFGEITAWGIPAGPARMRKPNRDRSVQNTWLDLHDDALVARMLGRAACMEADCWRPPRGLADAAAVGITMLLRIVERMEGRLHPALVPARRGGPRDGPVSSWLPALAFWGWSAGSGRLPRQLAPFARELAKIPEEERMVGLGRILAERALRAPPGTRGLSGPTGGDYDNLSYGWLRTWQKFRMAVYLAGMAKTGRDGFFLGGVRSLEELLWIENVLGQAASGLLGRGALPPRPKTSALTPALFVGAAGAGLVYAGSRG